MSYRSTAPNFENFIKSAIWEDILQEMEKWLSDIHEELEDPDGKTPDKVLHRLGGNAQAIRRFIHMPEVIKDNIMEGVNE